MNGKVHSLSVVGSETILILLDHWVAFRLGGGQVVCLMRRRRIVRFNLIVFNEFRHITVPRLTSPDFVEN